MCYSFRWLLIGLLLRGQKAAKCYPDNAAFMPSISQNCERSCFPSLFGASIYDVHTEGEEVEKYPILRISTKRSKEGVEKPTLLWTSCMEAL